MASESKGTYEANEREDRRRQLAQALDEYVAAVVTTRALETIADALPDGSKRHLRAEKRWRRGACREDDARRIVMAAAGMPVDVTTKGEGP